MGKAGLRQRLGLVLSASDHDQPYGTVVLSQDPENSSDLESSFQGRKWPLFHPKKAGGRCSLEPALMYMRK